MHLSEILMHLGEARSQYFGAVSPPIIQSSNFAFGNVEELRTAFADEFGSHLYTRGNNPTVALLRKKLAALEGAEEALVFPSGAAATAMTILSLVKAGDHLLCVEHPYSWTKTLVSSILPRLGVSYTFVDGTDMDAIGRAIRSETTLFYLESPNSMTFEIQDLKACAALAREHRITTIIDNSNGSPLFQQPLSFGIDLVMHTGTKYLNGHSDVVCGVVCGRADTIRTVYEAGVMTYGSVLSPHDAWLILRGLRTLELRVRRSFESALQIARWLEQQPGIEKVLFPFLPGFPQHQLVKEQMSGCAGLISIFLHTQEKDRIEAFANHLERFLLAVSWGGHESLVFPIAALYDIPGHDKPSLPKNMVRLYIGLEDPDWLMEDLERALKVLC